MIYTFLMGKSHKDVKYSRFSRNHVTSQYC